MHKQEQGTSGAFIDYDDALCVQQAVLSQRIDVLQRNANINSPSENECIHTLKREYNQLVKKRAKLVRTPLLDPMEVLPPDLWPDIIRNIVDGSRYPIEELLDLTSVSKSWCSILTTLPVIWSKIWLDRSKPDYLAKAIMGIRLSGECEIDLSIHLTSTEWREISSTIVAEGRRIRKLEFSVRGNYLLIREVLGDFTKLPALKELFLVWPSQLSDQLHLHASLTKMPFLRTLTRAGRDMEGDIWNPYITSRSVRAESTNKKHLEALVLLPQLRTPAFSETESTIESTPSLPKSSFRSVTSFTYSGPDVCRRLPWIGNNLSFLSIYYKGDGDFNTLLAGLSRFPLLHELHILTLPGYWGSPIQKEGEHVPTSPQSSVKILYLAADTPNQSMGDWDMVFPRLFPASPHLESLTILGGFLTDIGWNYIQGIANVRDLTIRSCKFGDPFLMPLKTGSLRTILWAVDPQSLAQVMARIESDSVQNLVLTEDGLEVRPIMDSARYTVPGSAFPNVTSLLISTLGSFSLEISALSRLRELEVQVRLHQSYLAYWVSEVCGVILMRPRNNPALEKITIISDFIEWDMLLLMLERRNFLNEPGISSIKTFVFSSKLSYRLLYPISELLGGRFVERDSSRSFSLEAIGDRMWDESIAGCIRCHCSFRKCEASLRSESLSSVTTETVQGGHPLPHESLVAEPPLFPDVALWLSGARERRNTWVEKFTNIAGKLRRELSCDASLRRSGGSVINGDTLAGAHFAHDLEEHDPAVEV